MNFNSLEFLVCLPVVLLVYWALPHKVRWIWLLLASYAFYMSWNALLIFLILATTVVSYVAGLLMNKTQKKGVRRLLLVITLIVCLGLLGFFKYADMFLDTVAAFIRLFVPQFDSPSLGLLLPVGISFYTFQTLSYVIDVYRGKFAAEKHFGYYALFVSFFPQLVAGPIERPEALLPQLKAEHKLSGEDFAVGLRVMLMGYFRKCVVADTVAIYVNTAFKDIGAVNGLAVVIAALLFTVQMYNDFAGYSEIATGSARLMGIKLTRNFDRPLLATSYRDFFRRWHITLTSWFTDYVYIPLGGSRRSLPRRIFNTFVVFALCGLWHGANWTFVLWGLFAALIISLEAALAKPCAMLMNKLKINYKSQGFTFVRRIFLYLLFVPAAILFRSQSIADVGAAFVGIFTGAGFGASYFDAAFASLGMGVTDLILVLLLIFGTYMIYYLGEYGRRTPQLSLCDLPSKTAERSLFAQRACACGFVLLAVVVGWMMLLAGDASSAFAYFQF